MAGQPRATSPVQLVEKALEFCPDVFRDLEMRKALRSCCRRLREAVDAFKPLIALRLQTTSDFNAVFSSRIVSFCQRMDIILNVDTVAEANAVIAQLPLARGLTRLELTINVRHQQQGDVATLAPLSTATWPEQLKSLALGFNFPVDFEVFHSLALPNLEELRLVGCDGENMEAFWRCCTERSGGISCLMLEDVEVPEELLEGFLAAKSDSLETLFVKAQEIELDLLGAEALATVELPRLRELHITPLLGPQELNLIHAPWMKNVEVLDTDSATREGLQAFLRGASGGQLRKMSMLMENFDDPFVGVELPALKELIIAALDFTEGPWQANGLFASTTLPALESVSLTGPPDNDLLLSDAFAEQSALPALKDLYLDFFFMDADTAAAIGKRLPRLTSFSLETGDKFTGLHVVELLDAARSYEGEWALERLTLHSNMAGDPDEGPSKDLGVLESLVNVAPRMSRMQAIDIHGELASPSGAALWAGAASMWLWPQLEELCVGMMGDEGVQDLAGTLGNWKKLRKLRLYADSDMAHFDTAAAFPGVADVMIRLP